LRDRLAVADRQRPVFVRIPYFASRHESMPRHFLHRRHYRCIERMTASLAGGAARERRDVLHHLAPCMRGVVVGSHRKHRAQAQRCRGGGASRRHRRTNASTTDSRIR
jgi:hypothetical protein